MTASIPVTALRLASGDALSVVTPELAVGGEGTVYRLNDPVEHVLKQYLPRVLEKKGAVLAAKLQAMVDNQPSDPTAAQGHVSIAWPRQLVVDDTGHFAGYIMPAIDMASSVEMHMVANPSDRKRSVKAPPWLAGFTWEYLLRVAQNLASATNALHDADYVIGDFNERNVLVRMNALVSIVDCDSMQVPGPSGTPFLCEVFRPEFTAPELLHANLATAVRAPDSDRFSLAVHVYQLLMEGRHPFAGAWHSSGEKPERHELAEQGLFVQKGDKRLTPQAGTPPFDIFTNDVKKLFARAFVDGAKNPSARPGGLEWHSALHDLAETLLTCSADASHRYPGHIGKSCPWCKLALGSKVVTAPPVQVSLPPAVAPAVFQQQTPRPTPTWNPPPPAPSPLAALMTPFPAVKMARRGLQRLNANRSVGSNTWAPQTQPPGAYPMPSAVSTQGPARRSLGKGFWIALVVGIIWLWAAASPTAKSRPADVVLGIMSLGIAGWVGWRRRRVLKPSPTLPASMSHATGWFSRHKKLRNLGVVIAVLAVIGAVSSQSRSKSHVGGIGSTAGWPSGATRSAVLAPVLQGLQMCAESANLTPANCPQTQEDTSVTAVGWKLYGDPLDGAQIQYASGTFAVSGHAVMTVSYNKYGRNVFQVVKVPYAASEPWNSGHPSVGAIAALPSEPSPPITKVQPRIAPAELKSAVSSAFARCLASTQSPTNAAQLSGCPLGSDVVPISVTNPAWRSEADPLLNSTVAFDESYGVWHVSGSYALILSFGSLHTSTTQPFDGQYDATVASQGMSLVVLRIQSL